VPRPPRLPPELDPRPLEAHELEPGERVESRALADVELAGAHLRRVDLRELRIDGGDLSGAELEGGDVSDAVLERVNLANLRARHATLERVELRGCRMTGLQWAEGRWREVLVADCRADLSALRFTVLEHVVFRDCVLDEADLVEARLRDVRFERCSLAGADLRGARFERVELHGCDLTGLRGVERLDGVAMPWADVVQSAATFAGLLGVRLSDPDD
jgi:uncharacterized protein YjbI with pentapeptide repeats